MVGPWKSEGLNAEEGHGNPNPGEFSALPGEGWRGAVTAVPIGRSEFHLSKERDGTGFIGGVDGGGKAEGGVIDEGDPMMIINKFIDDDKRTEGLGVVDVHIGCNVGENGR